jgi:hypothetical protein
MEERKDKIARMRQAYYERYENLQYQLMVIAGGTLTVFISINKDTSFIPFYKYGFIALGLSLIFGALSIISLQLHYVLFTESEFLDIGLENKIATKEEVNLSTVIKKIIKKEYLLVSNFIAGLLQFFLFVGGSIMIVVGLIKN